MSKRVVLFLVALLVAVGFVGAQAKTISFLSIWPETIDNAKLILDLTKDYQVTHPDFKVDFELVDTNSLQQKVKVLLASDDLPEVFCYESGAPNPRAYRRGQDRGHREGIQEISASTTIWTRAPYPCSSASPRTRAFTISRSA